MTHSKPFSDYDPLRPSNSRRSSMPSLEGDTGCDLKRSASEEVSREFNEGLSPSFSKTRPAFEESDKRLEKGGGAKIDAESLLKTSGENWVLKEGHYLSFAGILLFTALVFFRPYEYFPPYPTRSGRQDYSASKGSQSGSIAVVDGSSFNSFGLGAGESRQ